MERSTIHYLKQKGWSNLAIAEAVGCHRDTVGRETAKTSANHVTMPHGRRSPGSNIMLLMNSRSAIPR